MKSDHSLPFSHIPCMNPGKSTQREVNSGQFLYLPRLVKEFTLGILGPSLHDLLTAHTLSLIVLTLALKYPNKFQ